LLVYCNNVLFIPSKHTPHVDDRRGHGREHDGAEEAERVDLKSRRPGGRQQMIDPRKEDEDERHDDGRGECLVWTRLAQSARGHVPPGVLVVLDRLL